MKAFFSIFLLCFATLSYSMIVQDPNKIVVYQEHGNYYKITLKESWEVEEIADIDSRIIPQSDWKRIIKSANNEYSKSLLWTLSENLDKQSLWPYIETALSRHENTLSGSVANTAYYIWSGISSDQELFKIRTHPIYRKNLGALSNWNSLFRSQPKQNISLQEAVENLRNAELAEKLFKNYQVHQFMSVIALSKEQDKLLALKDDMNLNIAISSWYALSRINPEKVAYDIVSSAIWRNDSTEYTYGGGCVISSDTLHPAMVAYDLFSDYLTENQLQKILSEDPVINDSTRISKYRYLLVKSDKFENALSRLNLPEKSIYELDRHILQKRINNSDTSELIKILSNNENLYNVQQIPFTQNTVAALKQLVKDNESTDIYLLIHFAFKAKNNFAKDFIEFIISDDISPNDFLQNVESLSYQRWPENWSDLKQKVENLALNLGINK